MCLHILRSCQLAGWLHLQAKQDCVFSSVVGQSALAAMKPMAENLRPSAGAARLLSCLVTMAPATACLHQHDSALVCNAGATWPWLHRS